MEEMPLTTICLRNAACLGRSDGIWRLERRSILIRDGRIAALLSPDLAPPRDALIEEASQLLAMPGLVNAHFHSPDCFARGLGPDLPLERWSLVTAGLRDDRDCQAIQAAAFAAGVELIREGVTSVLDHVRLSDLSDAGLDAVARGWEAAGLRVVIAPVVADLPWTQTLPFNPTETFGDQSAPIMTARDQIARISAFADRWPGHSRISVGIGPSGPQRCSDELLRLASDFAQKRGTVLHMHVLETKAQRAMGHRRYGRSMIAHLEALGLLGPHTHLVHGIWFDTGDIGRIAASGARVIHNPASNARLGSGFCPLSALHQAGVPVALGTDSVACNDGASLFEAMKWAGLMQRTQEADPALWLSPAALLEMALLNGRRALNHSGGELAQGAPADLILLDLDDPALVPLNDPVRQIVLSGTARALRMVMIGGEILLRDGQPVGEPARKAAAALRALAPPRGTLSADHAARDARVAQMLARVSKEACSCH